MGKSGIVSIPARQRIFDLILVILKFFWYVLLIHPERRKVGSSWKIVFYEVWMVCGLRINWLPAIRNGVFVLNSSNCVRSNSCKKGYFDILRKESYIRKWCIHVCVFCYRMICWPIKARKQRKELHLRRDFGLISSVINTDSQLIERHRSHRCYLLILSGAW